MVYFRTPPGAVSRRGRVPSAGDLEALQRHGRRQHLDERCERAGGAVKPETYGGFQSHGGTPVAGWFIVWKIVWKIHEKIPKKKLDDNDDNQGYPHDQHGNLHDVWETNMDYHGDLGIESPGMVNSRPGMVG